LLTGNTGGINGSGGQPNGETGGASSGGAFDPARGGNGAGGAPIMSGGRVSSAGNGATSGGRVSSAGNGATSAGGDTSSAGHGATAGTPSTGQPEVRFIGRFDRSDALGPRFAWSGSGIIARFNGTSVGVKLAGGQHYAVVLDGAAQPKIVPSAGTTPIAQGLAPGPHLVELYRRTEANQGESQFLGFDFGDGELLAPPPPKQRRLEIVGDSITCGYGNEGANMSCPFSADTENHYLSYGAIAARELDAELVTIAWSGKGVVCNYGDEPSSCMNPLPSYYERALPDRATSSWDFSAWQPQAVVINLGTNDFSTPSDPTQAEFEAGYKSLLQRIRGKYKDATLLCTNGSMLSGADLTTVRTYIANVVKSFNDAGDAKVKSFELAPQESADGYGCDYHPSLATHRKMAAQLSAALKGALGW
jgi:lysophospholipase L1-like esterase